MQSAAIGVNQASTVFQRLLAEEPSAGSALYAFLPFVIIVVLALLVLRRRSRGAVKRAPRGSIFISYRRADNPHAAHRLHDHLVARFGPEAVFIDLDAIGPGAQFAQVIEDALEKCQVFLAVIGPGWLTATDEKGRRRIDQPDDYVRLELERALNRPVLIVPVLLGVAPPAADDLPESVRKLSERQAFTLGLSTFRADCDRLTEHIAGALRRA